MNHIKYPSSELLAGGHLACPGCGAAQAMRLALKALGRETIVVIPACCWSIIAEPFPNSSLAVPLMHTAFETTGAAASGVRAALDIQGKSKTTVMGWAGDGGTFDIGIQALSAAAERNENFIYVCYDNEAYMNTGIQRSSATPVSAWTTTTPEGKIDRKKDIVAIMAAHRIPYIATATPAFPEDLLRKFKKAKRIKGLRFIHILSPCPPGWKIESSESVELARLAVDAKVFPIIEISDGIKYKINIQPKALRLRSGQALPVERYLKRQGRFRRLGEKEIAMIQKEVDENWGRLEKQTRLEGGRP